VEKIEEKGLLQMEALLHHSTRGVHILFDNQTIARILRNPTNQSTLLEVDRLKQVQELLGELIARKTYTAKMAYLEGLEPQRLEILIRTYFNIVENTIRASSNQYH